MSSVITPSRLSGTVKIPPSKSMAHRAIICASLASGVCHISNVQFSADVLATIGAMRALGATIEIEGDCLTIYPVDNSKIQGDEVVIDCNESGSTLRFLTMIALALTDKKVRLVGRGKLGTRPMQAFYDIFDKQGIIYRDDSVLTAERLLDLHVQGRLNSGEFYLSGDVSSQFVSGLLFATSLLDGDSVINVTTPMQSVGYVDLTIKAMRDFGVDVINHDYRRLIVKGGRRYKARDYEVEGDYSQSAFFAVANLIGNNVTIEGLSPDSLQGDKVVFDLCERLKNAREEEIITIDGKDCPDIIPVLAVGCALRKGKCEIINLERLRIKECDRLTATYEVLNTLGAKVSKTENSLIFEGVDCFSGGSVSTYGDHRMAMSIAIASTRSIGEITIDDKLCVAKSYPDFWEVFDTLGGKIQ
ncbi:MAG: 3-phosphoshikimate 1-carboxyvinyltransferase [Christensenellales bacterium]